ncbi:MAG: hypothetical protein FWC91_02655 [Defluviitaleaceae bacterium]|nr:hypothetical protein [Defluviitaleaceae bacterium]
MKKLLITTLVLSTLLILVACGDNTNENPITPTLNEVANNRQLSTPQDPVSTPEPSATPEPDNDQPCELTIEELGQMIVAAGQFWEDWWNLAGPFAGDAPEWEQIPEHYVFDSPEYTEITERNYARWAEYRAKYPDDLPDGRAWSRVGSNSPFSSINDIRNYLLQLHTEEWVDANLFGEWPLFYERDGMLFADGTRAGFPRADWNTAEHTLIEQEGNRTVVETTVLYGSWHRGYDYAYLSIARYQFIFINGKITNGLGSFFREDAGIIWESLPPTIGQLGRLIESNGRFWESWWNLHWSFQEFNRYDWFQVDGQDIVRLLPASGFESIDDIRRRLSWSYTEDWINRELAANNAPFIEHNEGLYINFTRNVHLRRPDWDTATHTLIEQSEDGLHSVVETRVIVSYQTYLDPLPEEVVYRFTFVDRLIDSGRGAW